MTTEYSPLLQQAKPPISRPKPRRRRSSFDPSTYNSIGNITLSGNSEGEEVNREGLHLLEILGLTICMAGVQFTWTVELSYGTPYLLSLDLSKELTALVWLAGPLSGLIVQPLIGAFSDKCTSRFGKRRPFIVVAGVLTCLSMIGVAYAKELGNWAARNLYTTNIEEMSHLFAIIVAVSSFYFLDFTLNAVQAICRALILDIPPLWQQEYANAWSARMSNSAMVIGYFVGFVDLVTYTPWLGDSQIKCFCIVAIVVFISALAITCLSVKETPYSEELNEQQHDDQKWYSTLQYIWRAFRFLPKPIQSLCNTQFFAWMGWFPFLFYSTQWVSDLYFASHPSGDWAEGTRAGSFAFLCNSIVSVVAGVLLPSLVAHNRLFTLLNLYTASQLIIAACLLSAWFIKSVTMATIMVGIMGIPWAIVLWIPFSLVGEYVSFEDEQRQKKSNDIEERNNEFDAGMILGVHNMYIVFPQFAVAIIAFIIFYIATSGNVGIVLAFGGLMALVATVMSRHIIRVKK
ncbi:major facilitator superfamily domain-containing protein [Cokeromyces recurvatus]|uniref:major facilitator superfamily domain-containing protein n=1 Tax=Cokeromyces recurvatus TaxID=90255 RepID=UPI00221E91BA|nr:major facilitator superfamily domain-containing protein [Cokeromyces recurvatus]KAI7900907.1 major facilitator superfamily domain-containing protein [Cokeromyces recurvatus]